MANEVEDFTESIIKMLGVTPQATDSLREFGRSATDATSRITDLNSKIDMSNQSVTTLIGTFGSFERFKTVLNTLDTSFENMSAQIVSAILPITKLLPDATDSLGQFGAKGDLAGRQVTESMSRLIPIMQLVPGIGRGFAAFTASLASSAQPAINLERNLIALYAAGGQLNNFLNSAGENFSNLSDITSSYTNVIYRTSVATGVSAKEVSDLAISLGRIPGIMDQASIASGAASESMGQLTDIIKVQSAFGLSNRDVVDQLSFAYNQLGLRGNDAVGMLAQIARTAQDLQLPMDIVRKYTMETGSAFRFFGDNTNTAIGILTRLGPALRDSGLGPEAIREITGSVTEALANLNVGQKAFVSSLSGGPGGLTGALQLQYKLQQGQGEEAFKMFETAFRRASGGNLVTLQQAATTPGSEAQYLKQVELLKQVFGVKGSDQQISRLIDAFAKPGGVAPDERSEILKQAIDQGTSIQEHTTTVMDQAAAYLEKLTMLMSINNAITLRQLAGTTGDNGVSDFLKNAMSENARIASTLSVIQSGNQSQTSVSESNKEVTTGFSEFISGAQSQFGQISKDINDKFGTAVKTVKDAITTPSATEKPKESSNVIMGSLQPSVAPGPITSALTAPNPNIRVAPTTAPPSAESALAPTLPNRKPGTTTSADQAGGVVGSSKGTNESNELHIVIDTAYYENNVRKISREEITKVFNANTEKAYTGHSGGD